MFNLSCNYNVSDCHTHNYNIISFIPANTYQVATCMIGLIGIGACSCLLSFGGRLMRTLIIIVIAINTYTYAVLSFFAKLRKSMFLPFNEQTQGGSFSTWVH